MARYGSLECTYAIKLDNTLVFVDMKFNTRQASDKFNIYKNRGIKY